MAAVIDSGVEWSTARSESMPRLVDWPDLGEMSSHVLVCPVCGHHVTVFIDTFAGHQHYIEDCPLCLRAIELDIDVREYSVKSVEVVRPY